MISMAMVSVASAHTCIVAGVCGCLNPPGDDSTYQLNVDDFTAGQETQIMTAADAWKAGSGRLNRGADWEFVESDSHSDGFNGNLNNNVRMKPHSSFSGSGVDAIATLTFMATFPPLSGTCNWIEADMQFDESVSWTNDLPNSASSSDFSIGQTAVHEFGHYFGLDHDNSDLNTMNAAYPGGGDISGELRINEDEYVALVQEKGDASTGTNLMISKFASTGSGNSDELWQTTDAEHFCSCANQNMGNSGLGVPDSPSIIMEGTSTASNVQTKWILDSSIPCFNGVGEYTIATETTNYTSNVPFEVTPTAYVIPAGIPNGNYKLCVKVDANNNFPTESSEVDNVVVSEKVWVIGTCAPACF